VKYAVIMKKQEHLIDIIHLLADLTVFDSVSFDTFLKKLLQLLNHLIPVDSCLIYFYDREAKQLILAASKKSHKNLVGKITMEQGEGITGWVAEHQKIVILKKEAYKDKRFKAFKELPEDRYEAFLSVPIVDRTGVAGVINLQNREAYSFSKDEVEMVTTGVKIIASAFENIMLQRQVNNLEEKLQERKILEKAKGLIMKKEKYSEKKAYDMIRKEAMKKRKSMKEIAEAIILIYE
jgi:uroporphyrinogen-III synthase